MDERQRPETAPASREALRDRGMLRHDAPATTRKTEPLIRFEAVSKTFGTVPAVCDVTLAIEEGEFFCLLGPSGCGKTTLMRMLAGFETPTSGRILLGGVDLAGLPPHRRPVNMMFQSYALFPHMSVEKNVGFGLRQEGVGRSEIADRVAAMLRLVQLQDFGSRRPDQLSGGQRQRVALARALVKRPKVLLLDEPLAALDKKLREETQFELMDIQVQLGTTFLMVTHDQDEAMTMADRIAMMDRGQLVQVGTPTQVYEAPSTRAVAAFIGDITLLEGQVAAVSGERVAVACAASGTTLVVEGEKPVAPGASVAIGIRPEKLRLHRAPPPAGTANVLEGEVSDIGYLGDVTSYRVRLASGAMVRASRANAERRVESPIAWKERVWLSFDPASALLLEG
jgi:putrescine transport system ATP-binding protein